MTQPEFETLLEDPTKRITKDIAWSEDEDRSPAVEFRIDIESAPGYPIFVRGSFNPTAGTLTYAIIHRGAGRIYAFDLGKEHHDPSCNRVGETHKHRWTETFRDKDAYAPRDITAPVSDSITVWNQFCEEARIQHVGKMTPPPARQLSLL